MLEQPRSQNVGGHFREDAALLLVLFAVGVFVVFARSVAAADTGVAGVSCATENWFTFFISSC